MNFVVPDLYPASAEIFIAGMALLIMMVSTFIKQHRRSVAYFATQATLVVAVLLHNGLLNHDINHTFSGMYVADMLGSWLKILICVAVILALAYGRDFLATRRLDRPEFYLLALLMTVGMMVMASAGHMLSMYMGLEMMSLALYALVAIDRDSVRSTEAAMKYFVLGALASGMLLYGMSMIYGATGQMNFNDIARVAATPAANADILLFGIVFVVAGLSFKFGVVPFHMWVPDVYQGALTPVTMMIASAPKLATFALAMRLLIGSLHPFAEQWQIMLMIMAVASLVLGNLAAIAQTNIKRMLAYSGISHMGFVFLGLLSGVVHEMAEPGLELSSAVNAYSSAMFYVAAYVLTSLASFGMIVVLSRAGLEAEDIADFKGLNKRNAWFALIMLMIMFSMAGIPFFVGFFAKLAVLQAVVDAGYIWLAVVAVLSSLVGAFYYLRVVKVMYFDEPTDQAPLFVSTEVRVLLSANGLAIALLGIWPQGLMSICVSAMMASS